MEPEPNKLSPSSSSSTTDVVSDFSDDEEWTSSFAQELVNIRSPHFQPAVALRLKTDATSSSLVMPDPSAPTYLNLVTYSKAVSSPSKSPDLKYQLKTDVLSNKSKKENKSIPSTSKSIPMSTSTSSSSLKQQNEPTTVDSAPKIDYPIPGRRWLPHQLPVFRPRIEPPNTVKVMATVQGPLGALRIAMENKKRVKIWTRRDTGIRGYLTGFIEAFDKHWNIALRDVDEVFCRKRKIKSLPLQQPLVDHTQMSLHYEESFKPKLEQSQNRSRSKDKSSKKVSSLTKKSKRIASRSRSKSKSRRQMLEADSSNDLVHWCRHKIENMTLKDNISKKSSKRTASQPQSFQAKSKSCEKKHGLTNFSNPYRDANGFVVVGVTKKMEIVERHVGQLFVMGNDVVMVETMK